MTNLYTQIDINWFKQLADKTGYEKQSSRVNGLANDLNIPLDETLVWMVLVYKSALEELELEDFEEVSENMLNEVNVELQTFVMAATLGNSEDTLANLYHSMIKASTPLSPRERLLEHMTQFVEESHSLPNNSRAKVTRLRSTLKKVLVNDDTPLYELLYAEDIKAMDEAIDAFVNSLYGLPE